MRKILGEIFIFTMIIIMSSCNGLKMDVGLRGIKCGDDKITLDGDTFMIRETVGDSFLIIHSYPEENATCYLIKLESNGFYYAQKKADDISSIVNTDAFVCIDNRNVYDIFKRIEFPLPCDMSYLCYLGNWQGRNVFTNQDSICFSDGKCVALKEDVDCEEIVSNKGVKLVNGVRKLSVAYKNLYEFQHHSLTKDNSVARFTKGYYVNPLHEEGNENVGFCVDLDVPKGNSDADRAIRDWMLTAIKDDAFSLLGCQKDLPAGKNSYCQEMMTSLDRYGELWEKLCHYEYQGDTLSMRLNAVIKASKIVNCKDYVTYYYDACLDEGGLHGLPRSYCITYDKKRHVVLTASNTIKPEMRKQFRMEVLKVLKDLFDKNRREKGSWDNFTEYVFSFHQPIIDTESLDDVEKSFLVHQYACDEWSEWGDVETEEFTLNNFPLPHLAVLPEGIVVTYHPYQIDGFMNGEYHVVVPFNKISLYLQNDYHDIPALYPRLEQFVR